MKFTSLIRSGLVIVLLSLFGARALSQTKGFSQDTAVFLTEFSTLMNTVENQELKAYHEKFEKYWKTGRYEAADKFRILKLANQMSYKSMAPVPEYLGLLKNLVTFIEKDLYPSKFKEYMGIAEAVVKDGKVAFNSFSDLAYNLYARNLLLESGDRVWQVDGDYVFNYNAKSSFLSFKEVTLISYIRGGDTLRISESSGKFFPATQIWIGNGGTVDWRRFNYAPDDLYCKLKYYKIDMGKSEYIADSVLYYNKEINAKGLLGRLTDKVQATRYGDKSSYPRFDLYSTDFELALVPKYVYYKGSFSMRGSDIVAKEVGEDKATIVFYYNDTAKVIVRTKEFLINKEKLYAQKVAATIYIDKDSIYHPQLTLNYIMKEKRLNLSRTKEGISQSPYFDSYHKLEMVIDEVNWKQEEPRLTIKNTFSDNYAVIESANFFRDMNYEQIMGLMAYHPLEKLRKHCEMRRSNKTTLTDYAQYLGNSKDNVIIQVILLADMGYLYYDADKEEITVKNKTSDWVLAHFGAKDYDNIRFQSLIEKRPNGEINFINNNLVLQGVPRISYSDSQQVYAFPNEQTLTVKKNRDMEFDGMVHAGRLEFFGKNFKFEYTPFMFKLDNIDSMTIYYPFVDPVSGYSYDKRLSSVLENIYGKLYIDHPSNKSGRKNFSEYPIFVNEKVSYVYYEKPYNGVYKKKDFFFEVEPFTLDSLDNFTAEGLSLHGTFVSAGIFPVMEKDLQIMPDYSLGFYANTGKGGLPMYGDKGTGVMNFSISNQGLIGQGEIKYLTSTTKSQNILMFPDSTNAQSESWTNTRSAIYPEVAGTGVFMHWMPKQDSMYAYSGQTPLNMFGGIATLEGNVALTPTDMSGAGKLDYQEATFYSADYKFKPMGFKSEETRFILKSVDPEKFALQAYNAQADVDFDKRIGKFHSNLDGMGLEFPYNQYKSSIDDFQWNMDPKTIDMKASPQRKDHTLFLSVHPQQDSLFFKANSGHYDLNTFVLTATEVPYIDITDARVLPDSNKLVVRKDADIDPLFNAKILADTSHQWHQLFDCDLKIYTRYSMNGKGKYLYIDNRKEKQTIEFSKITADYKTKRMYAQGYISDSATFLLGDRFQFRGNVTLNSNLKRMEFEGMVIPLHKFESIQSQYFRLKPTRIEPDTLYFVFRERPENMDQKELFGTINLNKDSTFVYPSFMSRQIIPTDHVLFKTGGVLTFDRTQNQFKFGDSSKVFGNAMRGQYMTFDDQAGMINGEGKFDFGFKNLNGFTLDAAGKVEHNTLGNTYELVTVMAVDFAIPSEAMKSMQKTFERSLENARDQNNNDPTVVKGLAELADSAKAEKILAKLKETSIIEEDQNFTTTFFFTNVTFTTNVSNKTIISTGDIGLGFIGDKRYDKRIKGKIQYYRKRNVDYITIYIEADLETYFYFTYNTANKTMYYYSNSQDFNTKMKDKSDKIKAKDVKLRIGNERDKIKFLNKL